MPTLRTADMCKLKTIEGDSRACIFGFVSAGLIAAIGACNVQAESPQIDDQFPMSERSYLRYLEINRLELQIVSVTSSIKIQAELLNVGLTHKYPIEGREKV